MPPPTTTLIQAAQPTTVLQGRSFDIEHPTRSKAGERVTIKYDDTALALATAYVQDNDIIWTFRGIRLGRTKVEVVVSDGVEAQPIVTVGHDVFVVVFDRESSTLLD